MQGVYEEIRKSYGVGVQGSIATAHLAEGSEYRKIASETECQELLNNWEQLKAADAKLNKKNKSKK